MKGLIINHQIEVHLPVEIPHKVYEQASQLFLEHLKKFCEDQLHLGGDYVKKSSLEQGFYKDGVTQVCHIPYEEKQPLQEGSLSKIGHRVRPLPGIMPEEDSVFMKEIKELKEKTFDHKEYREFMYKNAKRCLKYLIKKEKTPYYALHNQMLKMGFNKNHISAAFTHHSRLLSKYRKDEKML